MTKNQRSTPDHNENTEIHSVHCTRFSDIFCNVYRIFFIKEN